MAAVHDTMRYPTCEVETFCPGRRHALPGARVVIQQPAPAEPVRGQPSDLEIHARELGRTRELFTDMPVRHTGRTAERVAAGIERDTVLDAAAARGYGPVDRVVDRKLSQPPHDAR